MLEAIRYKRGQLSILNQLLLPKESCYDLINSVQDGWDAIHTMKVRGAPAIAIVGVLSLAIELHSSQFCSKKALNDYILDRLKYLITARPTAVNIKKAADRMINLSECMLEKDINITDMKICIIKEAELMLEEDVLTNKAIGYHGAQHILENCNIRPLSVLTHCNTGSLATAGFGTALGVIRQLQSLGKLHHAYCTETRPYNQGARLTAYELIHDSIPASLICDSMVAALMASGKVSAVVVGADRVVENGDTANKIGTYQIAICSKYHNVPFYVASPCSTLDMSLANGLSIPIEERPYSEMTTIQGIQIAASGINCWNPAFDVTPAELITGGIITEKGVIPPNKLKTLLL